MVKHKNARKTFVHRNHTILTGFRHKQKNATLVLLNRLDLKYLVGTNVVTYVNQKKARLNYKQGRQGLPCLEKNLASFYNEKTQAYL